jgi:protein TonB
MSQPATPKLPAWCADAEERLRFLLVVAVAFHLILIILLGFDFPRSNQNSHTIEITLAPGPSSNPPEQAKFAAQSNQLGAGSDLNEQEAFITERARFNDNQVNKLASKKGLGGTTQLIVDANNQGKANQSRQASAGSIAVVTTSTESTPASQENSAVEAVASSSAAGDATSLSERNSEIASLEARIRNEQQKIAAKGRVARYTSLSTLAHQDAIYLDRWRQRIEAIGNLNYPREARAKGIEGSLRLLVSIRADGSVERLELLESSGQLVLDDAAIRIVRTAAPFEPFTAEMRKRLDRIEVIRTWKFEKETKIY